MIVGVPKEIKTHEYRVGIVPSGVIELVKRGHQVLIEEDAGKPSGISNDEYAQAGAKITDVETVFKEADMIIKVKEPQPGEFPRLQEGQILYTYLHLAPDPEQAQAILERKIIGVAYETIQLPNSSLPLLVPMSEVAGRMAVQVGAKCLEKELGGYGILLGGVPGVERATVTIIGGGVVGRNAAKIAVGMGANVRILDINLERLAYIDDIFGSSVTTLMSNHVNIVESANMSDLLIGAVLIPGAKAPKLLTRSMLARMKEGAVIVDVAIDQGGCIETSRPTTHDNPTFVVDGVVHYCVTNMPGALPRTSTFALTNATMPYAYMLADGGVTRATMRNETLMKGVNVYKGRVTYQAVAEALDYEYAPIMDLVE
jgi:alanine dehydrogenase